MSQKKKNSKAKRKAQAARGAAQRSRELDSEKKVSVEDKQRQDVEKNADVQKSGENLSLYTGVAMLEALVAAAAAVFAMVIWAKPAYYLLDALFNKGYGASNIEVLNVFYFEEMEVLAHAETFMLIASILLAIVAIGAIVAVVRAMDASRKPIVIINAIGFVLSAVALVMFILSGCQIMDEINTHEYLCTLEKDPYFNIYACCFAVLIINIAGALMNVFAGLSGLKKWKRDGNAY